MKVQWQVTFTDIDDQGIVGVFGLDRAKQIISIVKTLNQAAIAA